MRFLGITACLLASLGACQPDTPPVIPSAPPPVAPRPVAPTPPSSIYPPARLGDAVDELPGLKVPDPYRWLEDLDSTETRAWIAAENRLTDTTLGAFPGKDRLRARLAELYRYATSGVPERHGSRWYWTERQPDQEQAVVYAAKTPDAAITSVVDANALSPDGKLAFAGYAVSERGDTLAYGMAEGGATGKRGGCRLSGLAKISPTLSAASSTTRRR